MLTRQGGFLIYLGVKMSKRFCDSNIWDDAWYRKLPGRYKLLWNYICNKCDYAGIWKVDIETATYYIGSPLNLEEALNLFNTLKERLIVLDNGSKWFIKDFIKFQYGHLGTNHLSLKIKSMLESEGLPNPYDTLNEGIKIKINDKIKINSNSNIARFNPEVCDLVHKTAKKIRSGDGKDRH